MNSPVKLRFAGLLSNHHLYKPLKNYPYETSI
ncbi:hypothetical protein PSM36_0805 [Proteiniphilum saccharofermentans]|uniref:Uncharacterized protein n=1 Tax=Proteiniphilum saccharofermentans TaxID=1642647 RepID=A0A1R3SVP0_9BACT|nr:hypothetical protein PSM36_0805 [Proteiniphilum saccharofermentans]SEA00288.1 hypothetical protein SAMN05216331_11419 [Porphyromonadaceae bacterium KH3R12]SFS82126.1 hypothetical protein SAMN05216365_1218 [Porphyromonadaceae bacterium NLAE-zl-C104]